jgi:hypothetical protein
MSRARDNASGALPGNIVQVVSSETTNTLSGTIGAATDPSSSQGTLFHSFLFTPKFANSKLLLQSTNLVMGETANAQDEFYMAAYYDSTRIAMVVPTVPYSVSAGSLNFGFYSFNNIFNSWGTTQKTISIRVGAASSGTSAFVNTNFFYNTFGSPNRVVSYTIQEIAQ